MINQTQFANSRGSKLMSSSIMGIVKIQTKKGWKQPVGISDAELASTEVD